MMHHLFSQYPDSTCLVYRGEELIFSSTHKGVKPLLDYMKAYGKSEVPLTVVDKIMGRGAVLLAKLIGANKIMTPIMSESALELAKFYGLECETDKVVPYIINRQGDGRCPIEAAVLDTTDEAVGYEIIKQTISQLMSQGNQ